MRLCSFLVALCGCLLFAGCGSTRNETQHQTHQEQAVTKTTTVATKTIATPEGPVVAEVIETVTTSETMTRGEAASELKSQTVIQPPAILPVLAKGVQAVAGATPWGTLLTGALAVVSTAAAGWKAVQAARSDTQAKAEAKRADEHKDDAAEGWALANTNALKVTPA